MTSENKYFLDYQVNWILDESDKKIYPKSRRVGITYATSYRCVQKCLKKPNGTDFKQWVSSRDKVTAQEFITDYVKKWCKVANVAARGLEGDDVQVVDEKSGITAMVVTFSNGARIISLTSNPLAFAGKGGDILLDEMDLHEDQETLFNMAKPCTMWGGQLEIVSAYDPKGSDDTFFARLCAQIESDIPGSGWSYHKTTIEDGIASGIVEKINEIRATSGREAQSRDAFLADCKKGLSMDAFNSQYMCIPNRASGESAIRYNDISFAKKHYAIAFLDVTGNAAAGDPIDPCAEAYFEADFWKTLLPHGEYVFGWDIARKGDLSAIWIDSLTSGVYSLQSLILMRNCKFETQRRIVAAILTGLNAIGCGDATGLGMSVCETLEDEFKGRFFGINFASKKFEIVTHFDTIFENNLQEIPMEPALIAADIYAEKKSTATNGKMIFRETQNAYEPASHCDIFMAGGLAKFTAFQEVVMACQMAPVYTRGYGDSGEKIQRGEPMKNYREEQLSVFGGY